jgi:hypothetical protein
MGLNRDAMGLNRDAMGLNRDAMGLNRDAMGLNRSVGNRFEHRLTQVENVTTQSNATISTRNDIYNLSPWGANQVEFRSINIVGVIIDSAISIVV